MASVRLPLAFITTFTSGIVTGFILKPFDVDDEEKSLIEENKTSEKSSTSTSEIKVEKVDSIDDKLTNLINKFATNVSVLGAENFEAKQLALQIGKYGFPSYSNLRFHSSFCCSMDYVRSNPSWVAEFITLQDLQTENKPKRSTSFKVDKLTPKSFRAKSSDYLKSGYHRGHLGAAGNHIDSKQHMISTFNLCNVIPQNGKMNTGIWNKLEEFCRDLIKSKTYDDLIIISGPIYKPQFFINSSNITLLHDMNETIGKSDVHVPTHLFKVLLAHKRLNEKSQYDLYSFIIKNEAVEKKSKINEYSVDIKLIEKLTGLQFFAHKMDIIPIRYMHKSQF